MIPSDCIELLAGEMIDQHLEPLIRLIVNLETKDAIHLHVLRQAQKLRSMMNAVPFNFGSSTGKNIAQ